MVGVMDIMVILIEIMVTMAIIIMVTTVIIDTIPVEAFRIAQAEEEAIILELQDTHQVVIIQILQDAVVLQVLQIM